MADRYWVGGTGTWDATTTTNWASSSGGAGGSSVPTSADNVFFTTASNATAYAVTVATTVNCLNISFQSPTAGIFTFTSSATAIINVSGNFSVISSTRVAFSTTAGAALNFIATTTGKTIDTLLSTISIGPMAVTFDGVGGAWAIQTAFVALGGTITLTNGSLSGISAAYLSCGTFLSNNTNTRSINFNICTIVLSSTGTVLTINATGLTFSATSSTWAISGASPIWTGGGVTYGGVSFTSTSAGTVTIIGSSSYEGFSVTSPNVIGLKTILLDNVSTIINNTLSINGGAANANPTMRIFIKNNILASGNTASVGFNVVSPGLVQASGDVDFFGINMSGLTWASAQTRHGDCGGNTNILFPAAKIVYWNLAGAQVWSATAWALIDGGTPALNNFPLPQDTAKFTNTGSVTGTITMSTIFNVGTLDTSTRLSAMTLQVNGGANVYKDWYLSGAITNSGAGALKFLGTSTQTLTTNGVIVSQVITINSSGGSLVLGSALTSSQIFTLLSGTFDTSASSYSVTIPSFVSTVTNPRILKLNVSTITNPGNWNIDYNNCTDVYNIAGPYATLDFGGTTKTLTATNATKFPYIINQSSSGALTIASPITSIPDIKNSFSVTGATTITLAANISVDAFSASGAAAKLLTLNSSVAGTQRTITLTTGGIVSTNYMSIRDINATGGTWYAGANSTNVSNNTGWIFTAPPVIYLYARLFNTGIFASSNTISLNEVTKTTSNISTSAIYSSMFDEVTMPTAGTGSILLNGTNQYISIPNNSAFNFGTGDFTIEFWLYCSSDWASMTNPGIAGQKAGDSTNGWQIYRNINSPNMNIRITATNDYVASATPATNVWEHWAVVRNGTTLTWYKNGIQAGSYTGVSADISDVTGTFYSGYTQTWGGYFGNGYISNLRILKGTALYTANFTTPTAPLSPITNTSLLLNNYLLQPFLDSSVNNFIVTPIGSPTINTRTPFNVATMRILQNGNMQVSGSFDEVTGIS